MSGDEAALHPKRRCQYFIGDASAVECERCGFPQAEHWKGPHREKEHRPDPPAPPAVDQATTDLFEPAFDPLPAAPYLWELDSAEEDAREAAAAAVKAEADAVAEAEPAPPPKEIKLRFHTAAEVLDTPDEVPWIVEPFIAEEAITELDSKIKVGKTSLALAGCKAILGGKDFLGKPTKRGPVLFLTEQPRSSFVTAMAKAGLSGSPDFHFLYWHDRAATWKETVEQAVAKARQIGAGLVVIDTLSRWGDVKDENSATEAMLACSPLKDAAGKFGIAFLLLRHSRKSSGDVGDAARGSSGFGGEVDIIADLRRLEGRHASPRMRVLETLGRFSDPIQIVIELQRDGTYLNVGTKTDLAAAGAADRLLEFVPGSEDDAATVEEIRAAANDAADESVPGISSQAATKALRKLHADDQLRRKGAGRKGDPHRYWRGGAS